MIVTVNEEFPDKDLWIDFMNKEMKIRDFPDKIKGCVDIDHTKIEPFFMTLLERLDQNGKITRAWIHFMTPGSDHDTGHNHQTDTGVYYLQTAKNTSKLRFPDLDIEIEPYDGLFVIVPAKEIHAMTENKSDGIRLTLAFCIE